MNIDVQNHVSLADIRIAWLCFSTLVPVFRAEGVKRGDENGDDFD